MARPSPHDGVVYRSLSAGYSCNERKQIPLFRGLRTATVPFVGEGKRTGTLSTEWRNLLSKRRRLRKGEGAIYQRADSLLAGLVQGLQGPERRNTTRIDGCNRSSTGRTLLARSAGRERRGPAPDCPQQQAADLWAVGGLVLGAALQATVPERRKSPAEPKRYEIPSAGFRRGCTLKISPQRLSRNTWRSDSDQAAGFTPSSACSCGGTSSPQRFIRSSEFSLTRSMLQ